MEKICKNCKFWKSGEDHHYKNLGVCMNKSAITNGNPDDVELWEPDQVSTFNKRIFCCDNDDYAYHQVGPEFGCIHFEEDFGRICEKE